MLAPSTYRENRARIPIVELESWEGQWVAFARDGSQILGGAPDLRQLVERLRRVGLDASDCVFERVEFDDRETFVGGAEGL
jgi:hypothetical protein